NAPLPAGEAAAALAIAAAGQTQDARAPLPAPPAGERPGTTRTDAGPGVPIYTAEGPFRRPLRRGLRMLPTALLQAWLSLAGHPATAAHARRAAEQDAERAFQWLFWAMTLVAYACLGVALIALLPLGEGGAPSALRTGIGAGALLTGLGIALAAWWMARRMLRR
ncbi:hypothetical protein, partial [Vulcaniibacterium thermophilum]